MARRRRTTIGRILRRLTPSAESFAAAAALNGPDLMLQLAATSRAAGLEAMNFAPPGGLTPSRRLSDVVCAAECAISAASAIEGGEVSKSVTRPFRFGVVCPLTTDLRDRGDT